MVKALWNVLNGQKLNTGTIITVAAFLLQSKLGVDHDQAVSICSNIMLGIGGITMLVGYIHKFIKGKK